MLLKTAREVEEQHRDESCFSRSISGVALAISTRLPSRGTGTLQVPNSWRHPAVIGTS